MKPTAVLVAVFGSLAATFAWSACVARTSASGKKVTYANQVVRIVQKRCQSCHRSDGVAPFSLANYSEIAAKAKTMRAAVASRRMPPWLADPKYGKFENDRSLSAQERETL